MSEAESKCAIEQMLRAFATQPLKAAATGPFNLLGYASKKTLDLKSNGLEGFSRCSTPMASLTASRLWAGTGANRNSCFSSQPWTSARLGKKASRSAVGAWITPSSSPTSSLPCGSMTRTTPRTQLVGIAREINKLLPMPALLLFRHGDSLTLAVVNPRLGKRDVEHQLLPRQAAPR